MPKFQRLSIVQNFCFLLLCLRPKIGTVRIVLYVFSQRKSKLTRREVSFDLDDATTVYLILTNRKCSRCISGSRDHPAD